VVVPPPEFNTTPPNLGFATNGFHLQVDRVLATNFLVIYASIALSNWLPILTNHGISFGRGYGSNQLAEAFLQSRGALIGPASRDEDAT
jgi:hypothetical protein